jgi:hypothetical protein
MVSFSSKGSLERTPTLLKSFHQRIKISYVTSSLHELAIPFLWIKKDTVDDVAVVISDGDEWHLFFAAPLRKTQHERTIIRGNMRKATDDL